ncbi:MAG: response regulator transcription factor [Rubrobacter sp.]|nr:response regulator transcription factor [Rubrobacter sp.]
MSEPGAARLVIVDDHELVRAGLRAMLSAEPDFEIVGEASDGAEALELCRELTPDLVLMDVRMPRMDGLAATREVKQHLSRVSVLILTVHENQDYMLEAIRAGASGYVLKDAPREQLTTAIRKVLSGESTLNRNLATQLIQRLAFEVYEREEPSSANPPPDPERAAILESLSTREREVLELLALGHTNRKIAQTLFISVGTVKNHVEHIFAKLGVSDRTQAVVRAFEFRIITPPALQ